MEIEIVLICVELEEKREKGLKMALKASIESLPIFGRSLAFCFELLFNTGAQAIQRQEGLVLVMDGFFHFHSFPLAGCLGILTGETDNLAG
ncbi:hypothetical protein [Ornatilinea apprima]|uniref:hypothetical protein n=1 Tax=Ornatilinea apprima TaxID=1134406 RepID=UPI00191C1621|nr:hypothetical protein [Ornatilinea apprima]